MATYPSTLLPAPLVSGYGIQPTDQVVRTDMEGGNVRARRRTTSRRDIVSVSWSLSDRQMAIFQGWFYSADGAAGGSAWFDVALLDCWGGSTTRSARFASMWQAAYVPHLRWEVTATLELREVQQTALDLANLMRGYLEKDVVLLWSPTTQADVLASKIGPDATFATTGAQYDESGTSLGAVAALHSKGVWVGPGYSNLFTGSVAEQTKTLTAQKYTVWCDAGSVVCGAYGTSTAAAPLTFLATAGDCTFTPSGVTRWMLTASVAPMPYVAPGVSVASAAGSATNGLAWEMSAEMTAALSGACVVAALVTVGGSSADYGTPEYSRVLNLPDADSYQVIAFGKSASGAYLYRAIASDGSATIFVLGDWSRNEQHLKIVQTNAAGTQFRVGNQRLGIDSAIQWGAWAAYDGSFNPLTHLRAAYGNTVPLWLKKVMVSNLGGLTDAQIMERLNA